MGIVEPDQPGAIRGMQREGVGETMWPLRRYLHSFDLKGEPIPLLQVVNAAIEVQQELEGVLWPFIFHIMSS